MFLVFYRGSGSNIRLNQRLTVDLSQPISSQYSCQVGNLGAFAPRSVRLPEADNASLATHSSLASSIVRVLSEKTFFNVDHKIGQNVIDKMVIRVYSVYRVIHPPAVGREE